MSMPSNATAPAAVLPVRSRRPILLSLALVAVVGVLAIAGGVLAADMLRAPAPVADDTFPAKPGQKLGPFGPGDDVPTSFGAISVQHAERLDGLTSRQLAGMDHNIAGLVRKGQTRLQASVTLTNLLDGPMRYTLEDFTLRASKDGKALPIVASSTKPGVLEPDASVDARIDFIAPAGAKRFWVDFNDPKRSQPITIDLGRVQVPSGTKDTSPAAARALRESAGLPTTGHHKDAK